MDLAGSYEASLAGVVGPALPQKTPAATIYVNELYFFHKFFITFCEILRQLFFPIFQAKIYIPCICKTVIHSNLSWSIFGLRVMAHKEKRKRKTRCICNL